FKCDAKIGHFRVLLCDVLVLQRMEPESDLFCQDHPLFTPLLGTLTSRDQSLPCFDLHETRAKGVRGAGVGSFRREVGLVMDRYDLSIVIPAYNEEARIGRLFSDLAAFSWEFPGRIEVILSDDGSTDGTVRA